MSTTARPTIDGGYAPPVAVPRAAAPDAATSAGRLEALDFVRGLVMVIMLLDHTRDFVHTGGFASDPTDLARTTVPLFLTRWITHFCAPVFVFLAGTAAYMQRARGKPVGELSRFLLTRGLWLALVELTVIRLVAFLGLGLGAPFQLGVIWAIGISMVCLAGLVRLPTRAVAAFGVATIALHNLLDGRVVADAWRGPDSPVPSAVDKLLSVLHQPNFFPVADWPSPLVVVLYPLVPWIGVMAAGYAFGALYRIEAPRRGRVLVRLGLGLTAAFIALRLLDVYGDPRGWQLDHPRGAAISALSFLNTEKYPPSLHYLLMTLGPAIALLGALDGRTDLARRRLTGWLVTFGRVPMFFYVLQWPMARAAGIALGLLAGQSVAHLFIDMGQLFSSPPPQGVGFGLPVVYAAWIAGVLLLYPLCRWYAALKERRKDLRWLSYL
jgi:uncharacterized membrane protein